MDGMHIEYENVDITAPENKDHRNVMLKDAKTRGEHKVPFCPQFFKDDEYLGVSLFCTFFQGNIRFIILSSCIQTV